MVSENDIGANHGGTVPFCRYPSEFCGIQKRLQIASLALQGAWGMVSHLALAFMTSRAFVYQLKRGLQQVNEEIFGTACVVSPLLTLAYL